MTNPMAKLWGRNARVIAVRSRPPQAQNSIVPVMAPETDWIARAIDIMKLIGGAGEMVAFPYIKGAANVIIALLEPIQELRKNRDDFKDLAEGLVEIVVLMRDETLEDTGAPPSHFLTLCKEFNEYVLLMLEELTRAMNSMKGNWVKQYWKSSSFGEMIARHERRLQTLRQNLILITVVGNRRRLEATASRNGDPDLADFQEIRPGDIRILHETDYVYVPPPGSEYDATITEHAANVGGDVKTVRYYKGNKALELWKVHLQYHSQIRHHSGVLQLFGVTKSPQHLALIFHGHMKNLKEHVATLDPCERVVFIYRMTQDNKSAWSYLEQYFTPSADIAANLYHYGHADRCSYRTLVNDEGRICVSIEEPTDKSTSSWRSLTFPSFISPISPAQMQWIGDNPKGLENTPRDNRLKSYLMSFCDMLASIMSQQRKFTAVSVEQISLFGVYVGPIHKRSIGRIAFRGIPARPASTRIPWFVEDNNVTKIPYRSFEKWTRFTIERSPNGSFNNNIITARTSMLDVGSAHLSKACAAQSNIIFPHIEDASEDKSDARERLLVLNDAFGQMRFKATFPDSSIVPHLKKLYLFVQNVEVVGDGSVTFPDTYWSIDHNGKPENRLPPAILETLGVDASIISLDLTTSVQRWTPYHFDALRDIQKACGFEPGSDEAARFLGFPSAKFERFDRDRPKLELKEPLRAHSLDMSRGRSPGNPKNGLKGPGQRTLRGRSADHGCV